MKRNLTFLLTGFLAVSSFAVTLEDKGNSYVVKNAKYNAVMEKNKGYVLSFTQLDGKTVRNSINHNPVIYVNGERDKYIGSYAADDVKVHQSLMKMTGKVISSTDKEIVLEFTGSFYAGKVIQKLTFDDSNVVRVETKISNTSRLSKYICNVGMTLQNDSTGIYYPDRRRVRGVWGSGGNYVEGPSWRFAWFEKSKMGMGLVAVPNKYLAGIGYRMQNRQEGWHADQASLEVDFSPLQIYGKNNTFDFNYLIVAGGSADNAQNVADAALKTVKKLEVFSYETEKLTVRPGQDNSLNTVIWNRTAAPAKLTAKTYAIYDLDTEKKVAETAIEVAAGEFKKVNIPVDLPDEAYRGVALRTEFFDANGKLIDKKTDFCSVTDFSPRDTGFGITNAGMANNQEGSWEAWNYPYKKNYVGAYEYYCWAPSTIFGLAPEMDVWQAGTEAGYDKPITKKFVKGLVDNAHSMGVGVYTWITGLWNYNVGIQHPEWLAYTGNGQPSIYNGGMRSNKIRRMTLKPNVYTVERARMWGEEMADSVDMFGWDGCRWDFSFLPNTSNDPLYVEQTNGEWYDHRGVPASKLYPDPDQTGQDCLKAWRKAVESRHPNFIYGTNIGVKPDVRKNFPKHLKTASTRGLLLFEDMLNFSTKQWCTFEKWGDELALRTDVVRPDEAAPVVGAMRGLPSTSVSYHLANYTCASAGVKWWAYAGVNLSERSPERNRYFLRFARYYFGCDFLRPAKLGVSQVGNQKILFKPFVRERKTKDGREIVIPMVNMPENSEYICEFHMPPAVRKNVVFDAGLKKGETATAWLMTPQSPEKAVKIAVTDGKVTVPALVDAAMVLIQVKGK